MNEHYKFSETRDPVESSELSENEIKTINNLGLTFEDLQKLLGGPHFAEGSYALIFELPNSDQKIIAKAWKNPKLDSERAKHENAALRLLRVRNFKVAPRSMGYLKSAAILFEEKIEGSPIENFDKITINQLAETMAKIHSIELNAYGKPLTQRRKGTQMDCLNDALEKLCKDLSLLLNPPEIISLVEQAVNKTENEAKKKPDAFQNNNFTLIHFDLNCNNILRSKNSDKIILIDWEQASVGDNAMDIAKLFLKLNFNEEQKNEFFIEYEKKLSKKDEYFQNRLEIYEPLVLINSILWRLRVLRDAPQQASSDNEKQFYD
ncbi:phosphotransferase, partial [Patescibacteria group bacterium]|nr:phosphotransferase [Patescibacteria group bacterium]